MVAAIEQKALTKQVVEKYFVYNVIYFVTFEMKKRPKSPLYYHYEWVIPHLPFRQIEGIEPLHTQGYPIGYPFRFYKDGTMEMLNLPPVKELFNSFFNVTY